MFDRKDNVSRPHRATCDWILSHDEYCNWTRSNFGLLWVKGKPGSGKSTTMSFLYNRMRGNPKTAQNIYLDFFFNARGAELQYTPLGMYRSLLNQLLRQDPRVSPVVMRSYEEKSKAFGGVSTSWTWQQPELERLLLEAIVASSTQIALSTENASSTEKQVKQITIFIDAIDEAGEQAARSVAQYFHELNHHVTAAVTNEYRDHEFRLKVCISSRHYPVASAIKGHEVVVEEHNSSDIKVYIDDKLDSGILNLDVDFHEWKVLKSDILSRANVMFQWVCLVLPMLTSRLDDGWLLDEIKDLIENLPQDLEDVYSTIFEKHLNRQTLQQSLLLFKWVMFSQRPLSPVEMMYALASSKSPISPTIHLKLKPNAMRKRLQALSAGLVEVINPDSESAATVQVIHQTVREFLTKRGLTLLVNQCKDQDAKSAVADEDRTRDQVSKCHMTLYKCCSNYLDSLKVDRLKVSLGAHRPGWHPQLLTNQAGVRQQLTFRFPFAEYATMNLFDHARGAHIDLLVGDANSTCAQHDFKRLKDLWPCWSVCYQGFAGQYKDGTRHCNYFDWSMCHAAALLNLTNVMRCLVDEGHSVDLPDRMERTPLYVASMMGHHEICRILIQAGANIHGHGGLYGTALHVAAADSERIEVVKVLLDAGVDVNAGDSAYGTALHIALSNLQTTNVQMLLDAGADVNTQGGTSSTPLHIAIHHNSIRDVIRLLTVGADVNVRSQEFGTALYAAVRRDRVEIVMLLLGSGANVDVEGGFYGTALHAAATLNQNTIEIMTKLIEAGANVNAEGSRYGSPLHVAALSAKQSDAVRFLLDAGADVNASGGKFHTALCAAAYAGHVNILRVLLHAGADANMNGGAYGTALHAAAYQGHTDIVKALIEAGADVNLHSIDHGTALRVAETFNWRNSREVIIDLLIEAGAQPGDDGYFLDGDVQ